MPRHAVSQQIVEPAKAVAPVANKAVAVTADAVADQVAPHVQHSAAR